MKHIRRLRLFGNSRGLNQEQIDFLDRYTQGEWEVNPNTGLVDVRGWFSVSEIRLGSFKEVKFGTVTGIFRIDDNNFTSLEGSPQKVGRSFYCSNNSLTSLEGSPKEVGRSFYCSNNSLTSLEGAPEKVGGDLFCRYNSLTSLKGAPKEVGKSFNCDEFSLSKGEWNLKGWSKILEEGTTEAKKLILTLPYFEPESLQREIEKNPGKWVMYLKDVWNSEEFRPLRDQLKLSDQFLNDIGDQSALSDLGF